MTGLHAPACSLSEFVFGLNLRLRAQPFRLRGLSAHTRLADKLSREEGGEVLRALDSGKRPPDPSIGLMAKALDNLGAFFSMHCL